MSYFKYGEKEITHLKNNDELLKVAIDKIGMIEREINPNLFESLIQQIIAQQVSKQAALTVFERLKDKAVCFSSESLNQLSVVEIQSCGMTYKKAENIKKITAMLSKGEFSLEALVNKTDEVIIEEMIKLPGIGKWSAEMFLIFSLARINVISYDDLAIRKGMMKLYGLTALSKQQFNEYKKNYEPYCSVASLYFWYLAHNDLEEDLIAEN